MSLFQYQKLNANTIDMITGADMPHHITGADMPHHITGADMPHHITGAELNASEINNALS